MLFAGLLDALRRHGFTITVDHELRLQRLLPYLDANCRGPADLCDLLCPLFATGKDQQDAFGPIFERWLHGAGVASIDPPPPLAKATRAPWYVKPVTYVGLLPLLALAVWLSLREVPPQRHIDVIPPKVENKAAVVQTSNGPVWQLAATTHTYKQPSNWMLQWEKYRYWIWGGAAAILLLWTLFEVWRFARRRYILQRDREERRQPPHQIPLNLPPHHAGVAKDPLLHEAARRLRTREVTSHFIIDLPATIREAVRRAGFLPGFKLRRHTREPVYLMLIDRRGFRDHQMLLFAEYARALSARSVEIAVYYFEGDPRHPVDADWAHLRQRYADARLLLATDGESLRHPGTGAMADWVAQEFTHWEQRALITPVEPERWGLREFELAKVFSVWSATPAELLELSRHWTGESIIRPVIPAGWTPARRWREVDDESLAGLEKDLGAPAFRWLRACAHFPELHWDLTLHLAQLPEVNASHALDGLRVFSLDWFRQGFIPREWCGRLAGGLDAATAQAVRQAIGEEFARASVSEPSSAGQLRRVAVQFQKLWADRGTLRGWWRLRAWARSNSPETLERDVVALRSLDTLWRSPLDVMLPEGVSRRLHEKGVSLLGLRTLFRFAAVALVGVCTILGILAAEYSIRGFKATESQTTRTERLDDVYFDDGSAALGADARARLTTIAGILAPAFRGDPQLSIVLEGHPDGQGIWFGPGRLGTARANVVKEFLVQQGLPENRFSITSNAVIYCAKDPCGHVHFAAPRVQVVTVPASTSKIQGYLVPIPRGTFQMGCALGDKECSKDEQPAHTVTITQSFFLEETEVTLADYSIFAAETHRQLPAKAPFSKTDQDPVVNVTWNDAQAYCAFVGGRLPTEAEWEYAARGGLAQARYGPLDQVAWYSGNSNGQIHPVGQKLANAYGLHDMLGNAWEWTADWYGGYGAGALVDPQGPGSGTGRVVRGGGWHSGSTSATASVRSVSAPENSGTSTGFRCLLTAP